jgi:GntR family transcriptional regulator
MATKAAYLDIKDQLIKQINEGKYAKNESLPSERVLSIEFGVSRMTARKAIDQLEKEGVVDRIARKGTFVRSKKLIRNAELSGFGDALRDQGLTDVVSFELKKELIDANRFLANKLKIKIGDPIFILTRLRCAAGKPYAIEITHIPLNRFPGINKIDFSTNSLFGTMKDDYKTKVTTAERLIAVTFCDSFIAKHMQLKEHDPIFVLNSVAYDAQKIPMEYLISYNPIDRTTFFYELELKDTIDYTFNQPEASTNK